LAAPSSATRPLSIPRGSTSSFCDIPGRTSCPCICTAPAPGGSSADGLLGIRGATARAASSRASAVGPLTLGMAGRRYAVQVVCKLHLASSHQPPHAAPSVTGTGEGRLLGLQSSQHDGAHAHVLRPCLELRLPHRLYRALRSPRRPKRLRRAASSRRCRVRGAHRRLYRCLLARLSGAGVTPTTPLY